MGSLLSEARDEVDSRLEATMRHNFQKTLESRHYVGMNNAKNGNTMIFLK